MKNRWTYTLIIITALLGLTLTPAASGAERVVVLDFLALDSQGSYIDPLSFTQGDLVGLSKIMSQGIAARLVQFGEFDVQDSVSLREELADLGFAPDTPRGIGPGPF